MDSALVALAAILFFLAAGVWGYVIYRLIKGNDDTDRQTFQPIICEECGQELPEDENLEFYLLRVHKGGVITALRRTNAPRPWLPGAKRDVPKRYAQLS